MTAIRSIFMLIYLLLQRMGGGRRRSSKASIIHLVIFVLLTLALPRTVYIAN